MATFRNIWQSSLAIWSELIAHPLWRKGKGVLGFLLFAIVLSGIGTMAYFPEMLCLLCLILFCGGFPFGVNDKSMEAFAQRFKLNSPGQSAPDSIKKTARGIMLTGILVFIGWWGLAPSQRHYSRTSLAAGSLHGVVITLERGVCFGDCPVYKLVITGDGVVRFENRLFVKAKTSQTKQISEEKIRSLIDAFEKAHYFAFDDQYTGDCPQGAVSCLPTNITSLTVPTFRKQVRNYTGSFCSPPKLKELENTIDVIAGTEEWVGTR